MYDQAWEQERTRLAGLEAGLDPGTIRLLEQIGVGPGWRCLEVGGGGGSIAAWLCEQVDPGGSVVATDLDTRFLEQLPYPDLEVRRHDIATEDLERDAFDLVHARDVLEHVPEREAALRTMVGALRPGGWILVEDVDMDMEAGLHGLETATTWPPELAEALRDYWRVAVRFLPTLGVAPSYGRELPGRLRALGLADLGGDVRAHLIRGGDPEAIMFRLSVAHVRPRLIDDGMMAPEQVDRMIDLMAGSEWNALMPPHVAAWGRKPGH